MTDVTGDSSNIVTPSNIQIIKEAGVPDTNPLVDVNDANRIQPRQLVSGKSRGIQQLGGPNLYADSGNGNIVAAPNGIPQVLMGNQSTFGEGFYVTKPGIDATKATSPDDFIFNSRQNVFKIIKSDSLAISSIGNLSKSAVGVYYQSSNTVTIAHNLGYAPVFLAYVGSASGGYVPLQTPSSFSFASGGAYYGQETVFGYVDTVNLYFYTAQMLWVAQAGTATLTAATYPIKYYLLQETAS